MKYTLTITAQTNKTNVLASELARDIATKIARHHKILSATFIGNSDHPGDSAANLPDEHLITPTIEQLARHLRNEIDRLDDLCCSMSRLEIPQEDVARGANVREVRANATIAHRHLEDAKMRLGKVCQAWENRVSCYAPADAEPFALKPNPIDG